MQTDAEVAAIAAGLTKGQRTMLVGAKRYGSWTMIRWPNRMRPAGWRRGLSLYWNPDFDTLTPLGLRVAQHLKQENAK